MKPNKPLTPEQKHVLIDKGTERAFSGKLLHNKKSGSYNCANCGAKLFTSKEKFDSGSGWPSFFDAHKDSIKTKTDFKMLLPRTEILCKKCGAHLGHLFKDAPQTPTGKRYCVNSLSLNFKEEK